MTLLSQIPKMSDAELERVADLAKYPGSPKSDEWKKQAREIMAGQPPRAKSDRVKWERAMKKAAKK